MGKQHRKETKRRRRCAYIKRQKEIARNSKVTIPVSVAKKVAVAEGETVKKAPAKKAPAKKTAEA